MSLQKIRSALVQTFESGGFSLPAVYENTDYDSHADVAWCEIFFIPNPPVVFTLGDDGQNEHIGILQVNLNYPIHEGVGATLTQIDEICTFFKPGSRHTFDGQTVMAISSGQNGTSQKVNGFYQSILTIQYRALTAR